MLFTIYSQPEARFHQRPSFWLPFVQFYADRFLVHWNKSMISSETYLTASKVRVPWEVMTGRLCQGS